MNGKTRAAIAFEAFIKTNEIGLTGAALALKTNKSAIFQWINGGQRPRIEFRTAIARWTKGVVSVDDWLTDAERATSAGVAPFRRRTAGAR